MGLAGKTSLDNAMMDEIVDVVQDIFDKNVSLWVYVDIFNLLNFSLKPGTHPTRRRR